ncbi:M23 family metallopeptidase [Granulicella arctica]|uniref:Murein DD-endopeptidase MepM/ murein hydrolase activator NlpD n=1 Tax=Granulicella arctica TaxID=940613 RepID=A0A7Y9PGD8_9BACT|nr:M23 family metallopeptidase [Granulicella arctica]NYF79430.1 murein DD-endopeptidase MepM/ murein hydrolase activator NlpD [Granulicella arctica]
MSFKKRHYILFVTRDTDGSLRKVPVPLYYAYVFVAVAAIGLFSIAGLAGSYSRMLIKTAHFNELRRDHDSLRKDYASLEKQDREKDIQAASLGSLASEVSALYGLTASKLALPMARLGSHKGKKEEVSVNAPISSGTTAGFTDQSYFKSLDAFYALRTSAMSGVNTHSSFEATGLSGNFTGITGLDASFDGPSIWPVIGPITSSFGQREDPVLGNGEGEFHTGVDIGAPNGTPIIATADGVVRSAEMANGYGREVIIDHGHGVETLFGHMSGFAVMSGQSVTRGQVIGYVGHSGRTTGSHLHYEVRIRNIPVNPHKYLRMTLAQLASEGPKGM